MSLRRRVALVGLNYVPRRGTGDKNSSAVLGLDLTESLDQITIISIRGEVTQEHEEKVGRCRVTTRFLSPRLLSRSTTNGGRLHDGLRDCHRIIDSMFWAVSRIEEEQGSIPETTMMFLSDHYRVKPVARLQALPGWQIPPAWTGLSPRLGLNLSAG